MQIRSSLAWLACTVVTALAPIGAAPMPKEDVVEVPAMGEGLFLHNLFQSNMVLQRDKPVSLWGWAAPGEQVTVTVAGNSGSATAGEDRSWKVTLPAMPASSEPIPVTVKVKDQTLTLENVLVGDVWLLGGQSNREFPLSKVENGNLEIVSANFPKIRILTIPAAAGPVAPKGFARLHEWSDWSNQHFRKGDWDVCSPEIVSDLSAIGYVFARRVHMASGVPIGVVDISRGGTTVETWTPDPVIRQLDTEPVRKLLADWDQKVAAWDPKKDLDNYSEMMADVGALIREAQYQTFLELHKAGDQHIGYTSTYDLKRRWYHPQLKLPAGERIARWALATEYGFGKQLGWKPPVVEEMKVADGSILLSMDVAVNGVDDGGPIEGFSVAGEDRQFHPAKAEHQVTGKDQKNQKVLVLTSPLVPQPVHYRYAWARNPMGNLQVLGNTDIPFATQRSDDWPHGEMVVDGELKKFEGRQLQTALRALDVARMAKGAAALIGTEKP